MGKGGKDMGMRIWAIILSLVLGISLVPGDVLGGEYPTREIEFIAAFAAGSNTDNFARLAAKFGGKYVGKPIVVVNKPGGGGARGFAAIAAAKPDGYTIGLISNSVIAQPYLLKGVTFHYKKSFRPIAQIDYSAEGLFVKKGGPYDIPLKAIVKKAKENPDTIKVGIGGTWTAQDFARAIFEEEAGVKFIKVPFPGAAEAIPALLGGHVDLVFGPAAEWAHLYKAGKVSVLAVSTEQRDPRFPDLPTFKEFGYDVVISVIHWVAAPAGTPDPIVNLLAEAFKKAFAEQGFMETADRLGATAAWESPEGSMKAMEKLEQLYLRVIKKYDLKPK
jgi:tripartite-type tricarboxylate transporter receptor subunit TctC